MKRAAIAARFISASSLRWTTAYARQQTGAHGLGHIQHALEPRGTTVIRVRHILSGEIRVKIAIKHQLRRRTGWLQSLQPEQILPVHRQHETEARKSALPT